MKYFLGFAAFVSASGIANASPTYLQCSFPESEAIDVSVDESTGRATVFLPSRSNTMVFSAAFTPTQVNFQDRSLIYTIDRTTLAIRRYIKILREADIGQCKMIEAPKRAF